MGILYIVWLMNYPENGLILSLNFNDINFEEIICIRPGLNLYTPVFMETYLTSITFIATIV